LIFVNALRLAAASEQTDDAYTAFTGATPTKPPFGIQGGPLI
jgi:hypothetical protein